MSWVCLFLYRPESFKIVQKISTKTKSKNNKILIIYFNSELLFCVCFKSSSDNKECLQFKYLIMRQMNRLYIKIEDIIGIFKNIGA